MKQFTTPGLAETRAIMVKMKVRKAAKKVAYANIEAMKARLDDARTQKTKTTRKG